LLSIYQQLKQGAPVQLPPKTTSFKQWAERIHAYAQTPEIQDQLAYWRSITEPDGEQLPVDFDGGKNTEGSTDRVTVTLDIEETQALLKDVPTAYHTEINEVLLTALAVALGQWTGRPSVLIDLESHGREDLFDDVDISRTVGWFTALYPVRMTVDGDGLGEQLVNVKEELRSIPQHGIGYGILRYLGAEDALNIQHQPALSFNYLGQIDRAVSTDLPVAPATESRGPERHPEGARSHLIEVDGGIAGGQLQMEWTYSRNVHRQATIRSVAETFETTLRALIAHCQSVETPQYSASDVEEFGWSSDDLDEILTEIDDALR
jgi:non-ribosomal peptide synthase protein (TIGR01720 family)